MTHPADEIVNTLKQVTDNEATRSPWWMILDPQQNMPCDVHWLASQITGPFFCRVDAEDFLKRTRYNFSSRACVYCHSGCYSDKYDDLCKQIGKV